VRPATPEDLITRVGRRIAEVRRAKGHTQAEFAELMGCSVQYVGLLERGKQNLTLGKLAEIAAILETTFESLTRKPGKRSLEIRKGRPKGT
jgi:transcriptional regulator with XRE-family HTH domain